MVTDEQIQRVIDGTADSEECRRVYAELRKEGRLGEILLSDAAAALFDGPSLQQEGSLAGASRPAVYLSDEENSMGIAAEGETPYGG